eukprot:12015722-Prorocentrum_lima.AAC.1
MTSSLVGSEMCIRDRLYVRSRQHPRLQWRGSAIVAVVKQVQPGGSQALPVSYTHLTLPTICSV